MKIDSIVVTRSSGEEVNVPLTWIHTLVIGSGAAGLNAAVQLKKRGVEDVLVVTEGLKKGTSINTGSDKQTYYKLSICDADDDSPRAMAETYFSGGAMHGDLALVEASQSARAFLHLVDIGVPFPRDAFGQFIGYKTDHDPRRRATSIGPYTSKQMCLSLIAEAKRLEVDVLEQRHAVRLLCVTDPLLGVRRAVGAVVIDEQGQLEVFGAENIVFAVGGPGGIYETSVYPSVHTGAIGLALREGAEAAGLPESQYGLASTAFRWNVSGTYMQVVPRFISTESDGASDPREFLRESFDTVGEMCSNVFLKGYQWPFDARKVVGGSSIIDILVYIETVLKGRRVFLDFRANPDGFQFEDLSGEAFEYLRKSDALLDTPIERLQKMNPGAVALYADHGIDVTNEPLEIAVCAQHNNGGLAGNHWWESTNIKHLFPVGEVNGSHGVYRPGGSALNAGQVGSLRAAEFIAARYVEMRVDQEDLRDEVMKAAGDAVGDAMDYLDRCRASDRPWQEHRVEFQKRMSKAGAHIRRAETINEAIGAAWEQVRWIEQAGCRFGESVEAVQALRNRDLALAHAVYLEAVRFQIESGVGSRGSAMVVAPSGDRVHEKLDDGWRIVPEDASYREKVLRTIVDADGQVANEWIDRRPSPESDTWFETAWARFRRGEIYEG